MTTEDNMFYNLINMLDLDKIRMYFNRNKMNIDIHMHHKDGQTVLHRATRTGRPEILEYVLRLKPDVNTISVVKGWTALHYAVHEDDITAASILINHKADINYKTVFEKFTPLHIAVINGSYRMTEFLLKKQADPNVFGGRGKQLTNNLRISRKNDGGLTVMFVKRDSIKIDLNE